MKKGSQKGRSLPSKIRLIRILLHSQKEEFYGKKIYLKYSSRRVCDFFVSPPILYTEKNTFTPKKSLANFFVKVHMESSLSSEKGLPRNFLKGRLLFNSLIYSINWNFTIAGYTQEYSTEYELRLPLPTFLKCDLFTLAVFLSSLRISLHFVYI